MPSAVDIVYYAPGGGFGHATRAAAVLRQVRRRRDVRVAAIVTTPHTAPLDLDAIPCHRLTDLSETALRADVPALLARLNPRVLVVDTFPFGIVEELSSRPPGPRTVLVARRLQARCARWGAPAWTHFDRVLLAESCGAHGHALDCAPMLIRDAAELWPAARAKTALGVAADVPVVLGVSSDDAQWTAIFFTLLRKIWARLRPRAVLRLASPDLSPDDPLRVTHLPLLELFNGVDAVVGPCGYHLFHETRACGVPAVFLPRPRRFDDQAWRAHAGHVPVADSPEALEERLRALLPAAPRAAAADYCNGAERAAAEILEWFDA